jgi:hypothetical protein
MLLVLLLTSLSAWAFPLELEVWFLTPPGGAQWEKYLAPRLNGIQVAQACEQVGDYCFDPGRGLYRPSLIQTEEKEKKFQIDEGLPQLPTSTSVDRSLVSCDAKYAFDIFCGEARPVEKKKVESELEVWVDTSSSMRGIDPGEGSSCQRQAMLTSLVKACGARRPIIKGFDTSIREISAENSCVNQGLNDAKRMMQWLEESTAKKIIFITDVYEYQAEFAQFLESKRAVIRGDRGVFPARQMLDYVDGLAKACAGN